MREKLDNECEEDDVKCVNCVGNSPPTTPIVTDPEKGKVFHRLRSSLYL